jgi:hypothetical protein
VPRRPEHDSRRQAPEICSLPSCDQRFLASEVPCCGSEMKVVDRHGPYKRWPETCAFPAYRVPKHKAYL